MKNFTVKFFGLIGCIMILLSLITIKAGILYLTLMSCFMYIHITITSLSNALVARDIDPKFDVFWKFFFIKISAIGFSIFFTI